MLGNTCNLPYVQALYVTITVDIRANVWIGIAVLWSTLLIVGRWDPDRGWDDRLGRLLGLAWLVYGVGERLIWTFLNRP